LARQDGFDKDVGPLGFFVLDFGPLVKKVGPPGLQHIKTDTKNKDQNQIIHNLNIS
jgi:hypothetical protein